MRLVNTSTLQLSEFMGAQVPRYAILTHTWVAEEVTFQDWASWESTGDAAIADQKGFRKIQGACKQAGQDDMEWLWVDTVCIDKRSSAELAEAINSMYAWYRDAAVCYAYLTDVSEQDATLGQFRASRWFTRGWTLQELLAPPRLVFYSQNWKRLGTKLDPPMTSAISSATGIDARYINGALRIDMATDGTKMSWLSGRETTRIEDIAYCMLGMFDINMPLLYGEGHKAFLRLQEEIIRSRHDHTLFCWDWHDDIPSDWTSLLAPFPQVFKNAAKFNIIPTGIPAPYTVTNLGLSMALPVLRTFHGLLVILDAQDASAYRTQFERACIYLRPSRESTIFCRSAVFPTPIDLAPGNSTRYNLLVSSPRRRLEPPSIPRSLSFPRFGVLLFLEPAAPPFSAGDPSHLAPGLPRQLVPLAAMDIASAPDGCLNNHTDVLMIPALAEPGTATFAALLEIKTHGKALYEAYYLFFMVRSGSWHCRVDSESRLSKRNAGHILSVPEWRRLSRSPQIYKRQYLSRLFQYFVESAGAEGDGHVDADVAPGGLHLTLGQTIPYSACGELRAAVLSGNTSALEGG